MSDKTSSRRDFLKPPSPDNQSEALTALPEGGSTIRVATRAMACEFAVLMNPGTHEHISAVGDVLEAIHQVESWLSIYKPDSEISRVNREATGAPVPVSKPLFELLQTSQKLSEQSHGAFDIAAGAQIRLWRECRRQQRIPTPDEIGLVLQQSGIQHVHLDCGSDSVRFDVAGVQLDPGAIGKGHALDEAVDWLVKAGVGVTQGTGSAGESSESSSPPSFLVHGGHSSLAARGEHNGQPGWPVGIGNPLLTKKRLGTVLLKDQAMSTSGSNIQFFRHEGRRYGHILDPRTAMPVEGMLSVTVFADSAAVADALSTAFFVLGLENARTCCDNMSNVGAILIPYPKKGRRVAPIVVGVPAHQVFWEAEQVTLTDH